jgi:hypothetical protein
LGTDHRCKNPGRGGAWLDGLEETRGRKLKRRRLLGEPVAYNPNRMDETILVRNACYAGKASDTQQIKENFVRRTLQMNKFKGSTISCTHHKN